MAWPVLGHHVASTLHGEEGEWDASCLVLLEVTRYLAVRATPHRPLFGLREVEALVDPSSIAHVGEDIVSIAVVNEHLKLSLGHPLAVVRQLRCVVEVVVQCR